MVTVPYQILAGGIVYVSFEIFFYIGSAGAEKLYKFCPNSTELIIMSHRKHGKHGNLILKVIGAKRRRTQIAQIS
jgi:hypothetical protein